MQALLEARGIRTTCHSRFNEVDRPWKFGSSRRLSSLFVRSSRFLDLEKSQVFLLLYSEPVAVQGGRLGSPLLVA